MKAEHLREATDLELEYKLVERSEWTYLDGENATRAHFANNLGDDPVLREAVAEYKQRKLYKIRVRLADLGVEL